MIAARPILFSAPMVRALLAGTKTQTRRVLTVPWRGSTRTVPYEPYWVDTDGRLFFCDEYGDYHDVEKTRISPYGVPGDRLWVRETWCLSDGHVAPAGLPCYRANLPDGEETGYTWRPSIFMRRQHSRITLEVTEVRVQRVQDISEEDARSEGVEPFISGVPWWSCMDADGASFDCAAAPSEERRKSLVAVVYRPAGKLFSARDSFQTLWDSINAKRGHGWATNPWVWCVSFKRVTP